MAFKTGNRWNTTGSRVETEARAWHSLLCRRLRIGNYVVVNRLAWRRHVHQCARAEKATRQGEYFGSAGNRLDQIDMAKGRKGSHLRGGEPVYNHRIFCGEQRQM